MAVWSLITPWLRVERSGSLRLEINRSPEVIAEGESQNETSLSDEIAHLVVSENGD